MLNEDEPPEGLYKKEEIETRLDKIPEMEKRMDRFENELITLKKRIKQCWEQIEKNGTKKLRD